MARAYGTYRNVNGIRLTTRRCHYIDRGDIGRDDSVTSVGLCVLEYIDGSGDVDRVGTGDVVEAYDEPRTELEAVGTEVSGMGV